MESDYISNIKIMFQYYRHLGTETILRIPNDKIHWKYNEQSNSIAIIVKHLWGNMLSRWTDFLSTDGEKEWRNRETEFDNDIKDTEELLSKWNEAWDCLEDALSQVNKENIDSVVYIRNQGHSILEACNRQLGHYSYHVGQLIFLAKMILGSEWTSLSIPMGASKSYNEGKFQKGKIVEHFTTEFIKPTKDK